MPKLFISYRRSDSLESTGRIYDRLVARYSRAAVFRDLDAIPAGQDFRAVVESAIAHCDVCLVVIGPTWASAVGARGARLLDPSDFVRVEIEEAMNRDVPIIPVLVAHASMPSVDDLPPSLHGLAFRNARAVRPDPDFHRDMDRLIEELDGHDKGGLRDGFLRQRPDGAREELDGRGQGDLREPASALELREMLVADPWRIELRARYLEARTAEAEQLDEAQAPTLWHCIRQLGLLLFFALLIGAVFGGLIASIVGWIGAGVVQLTGVPNVFASVNFMQGALWGTCIFGAVLLLTTPVMCWNMWANARRLWKEIGPLPPDELPVSSEDIEKVRAKYLGLRVPE
jgi:hypothetical protein